MLFFDMLAEVDKVDAKALAVGDQLAQLPRKAYVWHERTVQKATLPRIRSSLGAHYIT